MISSRNQWSICTVNGFEELKTLFQLIHKNLGHRRGRGELNDRESEDMRNSFLNYQTFGIMVDRSRVKKLEKLLRNRIQLLMGLHQPAKLYQN